MFADRGWVRRCEIHLRPPYGGPAHLRSAPPSPLVGGRAWRPGASPFPHRPDQDLAVFGSDSDPQSSLSATLCQQLRYVSRIVVLRPFADESLVDQFKVSPAGMKATADDRLGHVVSAFGHPLRNTCNGCFGSGKSQKEQLDPVALRLPAGDPASVSEPAQRRLEREAVSSSRVLVYLSQHQATRLKSDTVRPKRTQSRGDEIGIYEIGTIRFVWQELGGEGCLPSAVGSGNYEDPPVSHYLFIRCGLGVGSTSCRPVR